MNDYRVSFSSTASGSVEQNQGFINDGNRGSFIVNASDYRNTKDVFSLAKAFLSIESMTNKKLQKLCYYAKAWYLALYNEDLIPDHFEAWVHGAVQPALYYRYRKYGFEKIPKVDDIKGIPETFLHFAQEVYDSYGHLTGDELEEINHQETPWINARGSCKPWENCDTPISEEDMKTYYRQMIHG